MYLFILFEYVKNPRRLTLLLILINLPISSLEERSIQSMNNLDYIMRLEKEFQNFLKKYKNNSCIMEIFSNFEKKCDEIDDSLNAKLSYKMTICYYSNLKRELKLNCDIDEKIDCINFFEGDLWTTYITFSHHIDNLCFFYKTMRWEKSSEFLFFKLLNSSVGVLSELNKSYDLAEKMITSQELFSVQMQQSLLETLNNFKGIENFFENYTKIEEKLNENINTLDRKIKTSDERLANVVKYFDDKLEYIKIIYSFFNTNTSESTSNSFYFYSGLFLYVWFISFFIGLPRYVLQILIIIFFLFEKFVLGNLISVSYLGVLYYHVAFYCCRVLYVLITVILVLVYYYRNPDENLSKKDLTMTPLWMRKYFTKLNIQNQGLVGKFRKMNQLIRMIEEKNKKQKDNDSEGEISNLNDNYDYNYDEIYFN